MAEVRLSVRVFQVVDADGGTVELAPEVDFEAETVWVYLPPGQGRRCGSLRLTLLHREDREVYLRCTTSAGHVGKHRSWMRKWGTDEEDGRVVERTEADGRG